MGNSVFRDKNGKDNNVESTIVSASASCLDSIERTELTRAITPGSIQSRHVEITCARPPVSVPSNHTTAEQQQITGK